jgi:hypothetical protein
MKRLTMDEFQKLSDSEKESYAAWSESVDRLNANDQQMVAERKEAADYAQGQAAYDSSPAVTSARAEAHREELLRKAYDAQEEAEDGTLVKKGMSKLIDYAMIQDEEIKDLRKDVSEVAAMKGELAGLKKEVAEAKQLEKERIQKEQSANNRVFLRKEMDPEPRRIPHLTREQIDAMD